MTNTSIVNLVVRPSVVDFDLDTWEVVARENCRLVCAAECGAQVCRGGYPLMMVATRVWNSDGCLNCVLLTLDGYSLEASLWCECPDFSRDRLIYFERWFCSGKTVRGWACSECRGILHKEYRISDL
jgi:hypothetical protein